MPTLNARRFLEPRMQSILNQTLSDWELIVCDSFSDDGTWEYLQQFKNDARVRLYQVPREGLYAGWNECLRRATGKYVYVATADDTCRPELLERMVEALEKGLQGLQSYRVTKDGGGGEETADCRPQTADRGGDEEAWSVESGAIEATTDQKHSTLHIYPAECGAPHSTNLSLSDRCNPCNSVTFVTQSSAARPLRIAVCNFDYIDEEGNILHPRQHSTSLRSAVCSLQSSHSPLPPAGAFYGEDRYRAHVRSGYLEFLVHLLIGTSWTTMTAVLFPRELLEHTGLFRTDCGALADRCWAYKSAVFADTVVVPETLATWRQHPEQGSAPGRRHLTLERMRNLRQLYRATAETVEECAPYLPEEWKRDAHWRDRLLWAERRHYLDHYQLTRTALRQRPGAFLSGAVCALLLEPRYLLQRLAGGLAWAPDHDLSEEAYLRRILEEWNVESS